MIACRYGDRCRSKHTCRFYHGPAHDVVRRPGHETRHDRRYHDYDDPHYDERNYREYNRAYDYRDYREREYDRDREYGRDGDYNYRSHHDYERERYDRKYRQPSLTERNHTPYYDDPEGEKHWEILYHSARCNSHDEDIDIQMLLQKYPARKVCEAWQTWSKANGCQSDPEKQIIFTKMLNEIQGIIRFMGKNATDKQFLNRSGSTDH